MDNIDKKILEELQKNSSQPLSELSKKVGLSNTPCWNRIKKLEEEKIIKSKSIIIDNKKINALEDFSKEWFYIGANSGNTQNFTGGISDITFWNVNLSEEDVKVLYLQNVEDLNYNPIFLKTDLSLKI